MKKALEWQNLLDDGEVPSRAELTRLEIVTRARVTQIMKLLDLAPDIRESILGLPRGTAEGVGTELKLRALVAMEDQDQQRAAFDEMWLFSPGDPPRWRGGIMNCHEPDDDYQFA